MSDRVDALVQFFETLTPQSVTELPHFYAADCRFKDPFNDVRGHHALEAIFRHMFDQLDAPRFIVRERVIEMPRVLLTWDFEFRFRRWQPRVTQRIHGASLLTFDAAGLVAVHRDYWDAAEELYEKLPGIGALLRLLKRQGRPAAPLN
ncbi:MAG: nuclear transport factor 2 family protein [Burkholderiales bacterium]|jgi:steroid delta-isomerase|nr:nuclear transport factor 2 family protein [Burkholderiales bacterium]